MIAAIAACNDPLVPVGGSGGSSSGDSTPASSSGGVASTASTATTEADSGAPVDVGGTRPQDAELCPLSDADDVGIDTRMRLTFDSTDVPVLLSGDAMRLTCGGYAIDGSTTVGVGQLVFVPAMTLPTETTCEIELHADAVTLADEVVADRSWKFTTGDRPGVEFTFEDPVSLWQFSGGMFGTIDADGDDVIIALVGEQPLIVRSSDRGETFEVSDLQPGHYGAYLPATHLQNGVVHVAWQLNEGYDGADVYYSRSEPGLGEMSTAMLVEGANPDTFSYPPTVTSDGADHVVIAWFEDCSSSETCSIERGIHIRTSDDGGLTFAPPVRLDGNWGAYLGQGPLLAWVDGGLLAAWNSDPYAASGITLYDGEAGFAPIAELDAAWVQLERVADGQAAIYWQAGIGDGDPAAMAQLARVGERTADALGSVLTVAERIGNADFFATMDLHGEVIAAVASEGDSSGAADRRLILSIDDGETFLAPQPLDFLLHADLNDPPSDIFQIPIAVADDQRAHLAWWRDHGEGQLELLYTHGDRITPCDLRPAN